MVTLSFKEIHTVVSTPTFLRGFPSSRLFRWSTQVFCLCHCQPQALSGDAHLFSDGLAVFFCFQSMIYLSKYNWNATTPPPFYLKIEGTAVMLLFLPFPLSPPDVPVMPSVLLPVLHRYFPFPFSGWLSDVLFPVLLLFLASPWCSTFPKFILRWLYINEGSLIFPGKGQIANVWTVWAMWFLFPSLIYVTVARKQQWVV